MKKNKISKTPQFLPALRSCGSRRSSRYFLEVYMRYYPQILKWIKNISGTDSYSEKIAEIVYFRAAESFSKATCSSSFGTWLYRIVNETTKGYIIKYG